MLSVVPVDADLAIEQLVPGFVAASTSEKLLREGALVRS
jgi:hypothetical protein